MMNKRHWFCLSILLFFLMVVSENAFGENQSFGESFLSQENPLFDDGMTTDRSLRSFLLAQGTEKDDEKAISSQCATFAKDPHADLGEVLRAGCEPTLAQMSKLMDNPLGNVAMFINQFDVYEMEEPKTGTTAIKSGYTGILQFPKGISEDWNIINRVVFTVPSMPLDQDKLDQAAAPENFGEGQGPVLPPSRGAVLPIDTFDGRTTGFGDMYYVGLFSPKEGVKHEGGGTSVWGIGFDTGFPTATEDILGTGKFTAGPSALYAYMGPKWKIGGLLQHYWDYAGEDDRDHVTMSNLQYFLYYSVTDTTSIGAGPNIIANWAQTSDNVWTVPVGIGANTTVNLGKLPVRFAFEVHYSVVKPDDEVGAEWDYRFMVIPAVPSALFKWMQ
jgi:hypothetical protein